MICYNKYVENKFWIPFIAINVNYCDVNVYTFYPFVFLLPENDPPPKKTEIKKKKYKKSKLRERKILKPFILFFDRHQSSNSYFVI